MCTNYRAPDTQTFDAFRQVGLNGLEDLWHTKPWPADVWPDFRAPAVLPDGDGSGAELGTYGFWPSFLQPARLDPKTGRKLRPYTTVNARGEEVGSKRLYAAAWRAGQRCLIPVQHVVEPSYPDARQDIADKWIKGKCTWQRIGIQEDGQAWAPYCVAGIWKRYETAEGPVLGISMLTVNADEHALMKHMHQPDDEKRSVVILRPSEYDEWLHTTNVEAARSMLRLFPAEEMLAEATAGSVKALKGIVPAPAIPVSIDDMIPNRPNSGLD